MMRTGSVLVFLLFICLLGGCSGEREKGINSNRDRPQATPTNPTNASTPATTGSTSSSSQSGTQTGGK